MDIIDSIFVMLDKIEEKLLLSSVVANPENVYAGEKHGKEGLPDAYFPRLEYNIHSDDNWIYPTPHDIEPLTIFMVQGWIRWHDGYTKGKARLKKTVKFYRETVSNLFKINEDHHLRAPGTLLIPGFEMIYPIYHSQIYHEIDEKHTSFDVTIGIKTLVKY